MALQMFDLAGADPDRRFSPYCWRTRMALAHMGLEVETLPWRFSDKAALAASGQGLVPVLLHGEEVVSDSWTIALWLRRTFPDRPDPFGHEAAVGPTHVLNAWADRVLVPGIAPMIVADIHACLDPGDQAYFRQTREQRMGGRLEEVTATREDRLPGFRQSLQPLRTVLRDRDFISGAAPAYADYIPFACLQWARCTSAFALLAADDPLASWMERMLDLYDGLGRAAPAMDG